MSLDETVYADTPETDDSIQWAKKPVTDSRTFRSDHTYKDLHDRYRLECANRRQDDGDLGDPCIRCHEKIDYSLQYPHPLSWSLEHKISANERPELRLDRNNFASSHFACNSVNGNKRIESDIGTPSEAW